MLDNLNLPGEAIEKAAAAVIEHAGKEIVGGMSGFASNVFNGLLGDRVREWRTRNMIDMAAKTAEKLHAAGISLEAARGLPMLEFYSIFDQASQQDDPHVQDLWAGLLAGRMDPDHPDDFDRQVVQVLSAMNGVEARILNFISEAQQFERRVEARMPHYDLKKSKAGGPEYERERQAQRKVLAAERRAGLRNLHSTSLAELSEARLVQGIASLDLKGLIFAYDDLRFGDRITTSTNVDDGFRTHSVKSVNIDELNKVLGEIRTRALKTSRPVRGHEPRVMVDVSDHVSIEYGLTTLGDLLIEHCSRESVPETS